MSDIATPVAVKPAKAPKAPKTPKTPKAKKPAANHPPTSEMVQAAIKSLKERNGSSVKAIKSYIATTYKVDAEKLAPFIKKYLKSAVVSGGLVQSKGKGASGSFKLSNKTEKKPEKVKASVGKKVKKERKSKPMKKSASKKAEKKTVEKKTASVKTPVKAKPSPAKPKAKTPKPKKAKSAVKPKSPKVKKTKK